MLKNFFRGIISTFLLVLSNANLAFSDEETAPRPRPVIVSVDKCFPDSFEIREQFGASFSDLCEKMNAVEIHNGSKICNERNDLLKGIVKAKYFKKGSWACDSDLVYCIEDVKDQRSKQRNPLSPTCWQGAGKVVNINDPTQNYGLNICFDSEGKVISIRADSVCDGKKVHYYQIPGGVTCTSVYDSTGQYQVAKEICDPNNIIPTLDHKHPIRQLIGLPENENPLVLYELKVPPRPSDCTSGVCSTKPEFSIEGPLTNYPISKIKGGTLVRTPRDPKKPGVVVGPSTGQAIKAECELLIGGQRIGKPNCQVSKIANSRNPISSGGRCGRGGAILNQVCNTVGEPLAEKYLYTESILEQRRRQAEELARAKEQGFLSYIFWTTIEMVGSCPPGY